MGDTLMKHIDHNKFLKEMKNFVTAKTFMFLMGQDKLYPHRYTILDKALRMPPEKRFLQLDDNSLVILNMTAKDIGAYACYTDFSYDLQEGRFTYYLDVLEPRGEYKRVQGEKEDLQEYQKVVKEDYATLVREMGYFDNGFLKGASMEAVLGEETPCSACSGRVGNIKTEIDLRVFHPDVENVLRDPIGKEHKNETKNHTLHRGLHIRSVTLKKRAPSFYKMAQKLVTEFEFLQPCVGTRFCLRTGTTSWLGPTPSVKSIKKSVSEKRVKLYCPSKPDDHIIWERDGEVIVPNTRMYYNTQQNLIITSVLLNESGNYTCFKKLGRERRLLSSVYLLVNDLEAFNNFIYLLHDITALALIVLLLQPVLIFSGPLSIKRQQLGEKIAYLKFTRQQLQNILDGKDPLLGFYGIKKQQRLLQMIEALKSGSVSRLEVVEREMGAKGNLDKLEMQLLLLIGQEIQRMRAEDLYDFTL